MIHYLVFLIMLASHKIPMSLINAFIPLLYTSTMSIGFKHSLLATSILASPSELYTLQAISLLDFSPILYRQLSIDEIVHYPHQYFL
jgi:hypothetical protein